MEKGRKCKPKGPHQIFDAAPGQQKEEEKGQVARLIKSFNTFPWPGKGRDEGDSGCNSPLIRLSGLATGDRTPGAGALGAVSGVAGAGGCVDPCPDKRLSRGVKVCGSACLICSGDTTLGLNMIAAVFDRYN